MDFRMYEYLPIFLETYYLQLVRQKWVKGQVHDVVNFPFGNFAFRCEFFSFSKYTRDELWRNLATLISTILLSIVERIFFFSKFNVLSHLPPPKKKKNPKKYLRKLRKLIKMRHRNHKKGAFKITNLIFLERG